METLTKKAYEKIHEASDTNILVKRTRLLMPEGPDLGAFARRALPRGLVFASYTGTRIPKTSTNELLPDAIEAGGYVIDAARPLPGTDRCASSRINHFRVLDMLRSEGKIHHNCEFLEARETRSGKFLGVVVRAIADIALDEELLVDYGRSHYGEENDYFSNMRASSWQQALDAIYFHTLRTKGLEATFGRKEQVLSGPLTAIYDALFGPKDYKDHTRVYSKFSSYLTKNEHSTNSVFLHFTRNQFKLNGNYIPYDSEFAKAEAATEEFDAPLPSFLRSATPEPREDADASDPGESEDEMVDAENTNEDFIETPGGTTEEFEEAPAGAPDWDNFEVSFTMEAPEEDKGSALRHDPVMYAHPLSPRKGWADAEPDPKRRRPVILEAVQWLPPFEEESYDLLLTQ